MFHSIPKDQDIRQAYRDLIKRDDLKIADHTRICSQHWEGGRKLSRRHLPSIFPSSPPPKKRKINDEIPDNEEEARPSSDSHETKTCVGAIQKEKQGDKLHSITDMLKKRVKEQKEADEKPINVLELGREDAEIMSNNDGEQEKKDKKFTKQKSNQKKAVKQSLEVTSLKKQVADLGRQLGDAKSELYWLKKNENQVIKQLQEKLENTKKDIAVLKDFKTQFQNIKEQLDNAKKENSSLKSRLEKQVQQSINEIKALKDSMKNQLEESKKQVQNSIKEREESRKLLEESTREVKRLKYQLEHVQFDIDKFKTSDKDIQFYTSFENYQVLEAAFNHIENTAMNMTYRNNVKRFEVVKGQRNMGRPRTLTTFQEFVMVLMRLRLGLKEKDLAHRFLISNTSVSCTLSTWMKLLKCEFDVVAKITPTSCLITSEKLKTAVSGSSTSPE